MHVSSDTQNLDFTSELPSEKESSLQLGNTYDPRPQEDEARKNIAYLLIGLLWVLVGALLIMVSLDCIELADIKEFSVILGPVVTLVSAATGFYYGTKSNSNGS